MSAFSISILVSEDPRTSHRPAEALRIALGVAMGDAEVRVLLTGPGVRVLAESCDDLQDGDGIERHRRLLADRGFVFHAEEAVLAGVEIDRDAFRLEPLAASSLASLLGSSDRMILF